jgi:hypothetical protein
MYEPKENKGQLFKNDRKREGKQDADYRGKINIEGKVFWLNGWINEDKNGNKYFGLSVQPVQQQSQQQQKIRVVGGSDVDSEIPF